MIKQSLLELFRVVGPGAPSRYISDTETLRLTVFNSVASVRVALRARKIDEDGESKFASNDVVPATDRTASVVDVQPGAGWLVGVAAIVTAGAPQDGQTFAIVSIGIGNGNNYTETEVLAAGYISTGRRLSWPGSVIGAPIEGDGALRVITGTTPGAGVEISETVPTNARWQLLAFKARLTASATVANRTPRLTIDDGTNVVIESPTSATQAAAAVDPYYWVAALGYTFGASGSDIVNGLPAPTFLRAGFRMRTSTINLQVGDTWDQVFYFVREWIGGE